MGWLDERELLSCEACKHMHTMREEIPPCESCMPPLLPENEPVVNVYSLVRNQVVTAGMGEVVDLNFTSLKTVMDMLEVSDQRRCFEKVLRIFHEKLQRQRLERDAETRSKER